MPSKASVLFLLDFAKRGQLHAKMTIKCEALSKVHLNGDVLSYKI